jgi:hypothetical protein
MAVADRHGVPVSIESATPHEVKLANSTLVQMFVPDARRHLVGDNAYDSDKPDAERSSGSRYSRSAKKHTSQSFLVRLASDCVDR